MPRSSRPPPTAREDLDLTPEAVRAAVCGAWTARSALHGRSDLDAYRLLHGHHDGLPGIDIDRYGECVRIVCKRELGGRGELLLAALDECHRFPVVLLRHQRRGNPDPTPTAVTFLRGTAPGEAVEIREGPLRLIAQPFHRQNAGVFLDARPARRWLLRESRGRRVLNLFAYTGSLGVAAAVGGARSVVHVDAKRPPLVVAGRNHELNGVPAEERDFLRGDLFVHLPRAVRAGKRFDGIILDPPPQLPRSRGRRPRGEGYPRLSALTTPLLAEGAWLLCFFHRFGRPREVYEAEVRASSTVPLEVLWRGRSGRDFPERNPEDKLRVTAFRRRA